MGDRTVVPMHLFLGPSRCLIPQNENIFPIKKQMHQMNANLICEDHTALSLISEQHRYLPVKLCYAYASSLLFNRASCQPLQYRVIFAAVNVSYFPSLDGKSREMCSIRGMKEGVKWTRFPINSTTSLVNHAFIHSLTNSLLPIG